MQVDISYLHFFRVSLEMPTLWALFRHLQGIKLQDVNCDTIIDQYTLSRAASASCTFVCVFRFCLNADGNASGCERVVISIFSYAATHN
jgi:hypothetical protein